MIDQLRAISGTSCPYSNNDCFASNLNQAGYYVAVDEKHLFMDVTPNSLFMDASNPWGLPQNFDWLAKEAYVEVSKKQVRSFDYASIGTSFPTAEVTRPPTSAPTAQVKKSFWSRLKWW